MAGLAVPELQFDRGEAGASGSSFEVTAVVDAHNGCTINVGLSSWGRRRSGLARWSILPGNPGSPWGE
ncbi:hypothetical protein R1flu_027860 [Riccia fluitans]|uniref:Uncharacterized protein n=1 Tax=Riccia fluitans TaxID=41844 RepID=A0ABD1XK16_9MARC